jgi:hypothetical protein
MSVIPRVQEDVGKTDDGRGQPPGHRQLPGRVTHDGLVGVVGLELGGADHITDSGEAADVFVCRACDVVAYEVGGRGSLAVGPAVVEALAVEGRCTTGRELIGYSGSIKDESDGTAITKSVSAGGVGRDVKCNQGDGIDVTFTLDILNEFGNIFIIQIRHYIARG